MENYEDCFHQTLIGKERMKIKQTLQEPMNTYNIVSLHAHPEWRIPAARWFQEKWEIPLEEYLTSIDESIKGTVAVPRWYIVIEEQQIIAGAGVIGNDFHDRKDLTPNICALYVEPERRCRGIAGQLLEHICKDMAVKGISTLYLITEHTSFYERYGWEYLCMVKGDDGEQMRMYKKSPKAHTKTDTSRREKLFGETQNSFFYVVIQISREFFYFIKGFH